MDVHSRYRRAVRFMRRHPGLFVVAGVLASATFMVVNRGAAVLPGGTAAGDQPAGEDQTAVTAERDEQASRDEGSSGGRETSSATGQERVDGEPGAGGGEGATNGPPGTAPTDVAQPREPVDLERPPGGRDPVRTARWWAAVHAAYAGAEPGSDLAGRLAPLTTDALLAELAAVPPAASYQPALTIEGVSAQERASPAGGDTAEVWVTVETQTALVVYVLHLKADVGGSSDATVWVVSEADQL